MTERTRTSALQLAVVLAAICGMFGGVAIVQHVQATGVLLVGSFFLACLGYLGLYHAYRVRRGPILYQVVTPFVAFGAAFTFTYALFFRFVL